MADDCRDVISKGADLLHVDVMDGHFVRNLTMGVDMIKGLRKHFPDTCLDVHLMVEHPEEYVDSFAAAGANVFSFHLEVSSPAKIGENAGVDAAKLIEKIHAAGMKAGMVINPATAVDGLTPYLSMLDLVLVMSVVPGRSGQKFMPEVLDKTRWLASRLSPRTRLEMDGGINTQTVIDAVAAGADTLVTASALFGAADRAAVIAAMHAARKV